MLCPHFELIMPAVYGFLVYHRGVVQVEYIIELPPYLVSVAVISHTGFPGLEVDPYPFTVIGFRETLR